MNREKAKKITKAIKDLAQKEDRFTLNELRIIVALERATARLSRNKELAEHLVFKGGFVLLKSYESRRFTRDTDALAVAISKERLSGSVRAALGDDLEDGLWFGDIQVQDLAEQGEYGAYRFDCAFQIGEPDLWKIKNYSRVHVDIGFSDRLAKGPAKQVMPSILRHEEPVTWKVYPLEFIMAEKVQTLFDRGSANSRAKDIYDLVYLFPRCQDKAALVSAIKTTFKNRGTPLPNSFAEQAERIDRAILSLSWPSVEVTEDKPPFDKAWKELIKHFQAID